MKIIGCDFHTRYQQIAMLDEASGELIERRLEHQSGEAQEFYRNLQGAVRVGIEATGPIRWFERLLAELGHELWIGDSAKIRASEVRKQKTDERDARLILDLLLANRFPKIWVPTPGKRNLRQLLWHRHKLVCMETGGQTGRFPCFHNAQRVRSFLRRVVRFAPGWTSSGVDDRLFAAPAVER